MAVPPNRKIGSLRALVAPDRFIAGEIVRRERRWTSAGVTPARELERSTR